ncbi:hypothetical protein [Halorussus salinus]|uniref:hypothetical protein n=1 Tax=Halorussus salinus TaxID=1364935 RepID=UPI001092A4A6|nr:hypothetical protein [Halorussus salinus]
MDAENIEFSVLDLLSVVFGGIGAGMGAALNFISAPLPGFFSVSLIGAIAVLLTVLSLLLQAVSIGEPEEEGETIEVPVSVYNSHLTSTQKAGYYEGRYEGSREQEKTIGRKVLSRENHRIDKYGNTIENRTLDEFLDEGGNKEKTEEENDEQSEESTEYPPQVKEKVRKIEEEVLEYE